MFERQLAAARWEHDCGGHGPWMAMAEAGAGYGCYCYLAASWTQATTVFKVTGRRTRETGGNPANGETKKKQIEPIRVVLYWFETHHAWTPQGRT